MRKSGLRKIGKPGSSPFPGDAQNGPETTQLWRKFAPIVRVSVGFACGAGGLACGASWTACARRHFAPCSEVAAARRCWWQRVATHKTKTDYASLQHELCRSRCPSARFAPSLCLSAPLLLSSLCAVLRWCAPTRRGHRQRSESDRRSAPPSPLRAPLQPRSGGATLPRDAELLAECWLPALIVEGVCAAATAGRISSSSPMQLSRLGVAALGT